MRRSCLALDEAGRPQSLKAPEVECYKVSSAAGAEGREGMWPGQEEEEEEGNLLQFLNCTDAVTQRAGTAWRGLAGPSEVKPTALGLPGSGADAGLGLYL